MVSPVITGVPGTVPVVWRVPVAAIDVPASVVSVTLYVYVVDGVKPAKVQLVVDTVDVGHAITAPDGEVNVAVYVISGTTLLEDTPSVEPSDHEIPAVVLAKVPSETTGDNGAGVAVIAVGDPVAELIPKAVEAAMVYEVCV